MSPIDSLRTETKFKKTEIGEIPVDWEAIRLKDIVVSFINGGTPSTKVNRYWEGKIPWITGADFEDQKIKKTRRHITEEAIRDSSTNIVPKGSLLIVTRTGVGKLAITPFDIAISQDITGLVPDSSRASANFLYWYLINNVNRLKYLVQGTSINGILREDFQKLLVAGPPLAEQIKIADILSSVDEAIEKKQEIIGKAKELKRGLMQELLTRGIGHTKFKKTQIGTIPEDWQVLKLKDVSAKHRYAFVDGPFGSNLKSVHYVTQGISVIQSQSIISGKYKPVNTVYISEKKAKELERSKVMPGDIVIAKIGVNYGASATIPSNHAVAILSGNTMKITPDANKVKPEFLQYELHYLRMIKAFNKIVSTTAQPAITLEGTKNLKISLPKLEEQERIANMLIAVDDILNNKTANQIKLEEIKSGLMQNLLTGKIRITL